MANANKTGKGSSPALAVLCPDPKCSAKAGQYCTRPDGSTQVIAHAVRRRKFWKLSEPQTAQEQDAWDDAKPGEA